MKKNIFLLSAFIGLISACQDIEVATGANQTVNTFNANNSCSPVNYLTGDGEDVSTKTKSGLVLMGGGKDVDQAFKEMIKNSGGGDFIILRSSGADGYNPYIYTELGGVNSVETLVIDSKEKANCPDVAEKIRNAEALFIAGGDQSKYYGYWKNSPVQSSLNYLVNEKKVTIGGTSAGLAILGEIVYTAEISSVDSKDVLPNPLTEKITLKNDFLQIPLLKNVITDTHFNQRIRQGRLISFMANALNSNLSDFNKLKGIGVDENTAVFLDEQGTGKVFGTNNAWFFKAASNPESYKPFNWQKNPIKTLKVKGTESGVNSFNIINWKLSSGNYEQVNYYIKQGELSANR